MVIETMVMSACAFSLAGNKTSLILACAACADLTICSPVAPSLRRSATAPSSADSLAFMPEIRVFNFAIDSLSDRVAAMASMRRAMLSCRAFNSATSCCCWPGVLTASRVGAEPASAWVSVCRPSAPTISGMLRPATPWKRSRTCENISQAARPAITVVPDTAAKAKNSLALIPS